jgi:hypothetical protein
MGLGRPDERLGFAILDASQEIVSAHPRVQENRCGTPPHHRIGKGQEIDARPYEHQNSIALPQAQPAETLLVLEHELVEISVPPGDGANALRGTVTEVPLPREPRHDDGILSWLALDPLQERAI